MYIAYIKIIESESIETRCNKSRNRLEESIREALRNQDSCSSNLDTIVKLASFASYLPVERVKFHCHLRDKQR